MTYVSHDFPVAPAEAPETPSGRAPRARLREAIWAWAWIIAINVFILAFTRDALLSKRFAGLSIDGHALWGRDFVNVYTSGVLVLRDKLALLYDVDAYRAFQSAFFAPGELATHNYSYPPVTLFYTWVFALMPYPVAAIAWLGLSGTAFALAARPYLREAGLPAWAAVALPASLANIWAGHYGFVVGALWLGAWRLMARRPGLAGAMIGLMIVKPHLAVLAPLVLAWRRQWIAFAAAAATVGLLVAASAALFGVELWRTYLTETAGFQLGLIDDANSFFIWMMPTVAPSLVQLSASVDAALTVQLAAAAAAVLALLRWLPKADADAGLATGVATFLVLPYAFAYDMTVYSVASVVLFARLRSAASIGATLAAAGAFLMPVAVTILNRFGIPIAPLATAFLLVLLLRPGAGAISRRAAPAA